MANTTDRFTKPVWEKEMEEQMVVIRQTEELPTKFNGHLGLIQKRHPKHPEMALVFVLELGDTTYFHESQLKEITKSEEDEIRMQRFLQRHRERKWPGANRDYQPNIYDKQWAAGRLDALRSKGFKPYDCHGGCPWWSFAGSAYLDGYCGLPLTLHIGFCQF